MVESLKELNQICQKPRYREVGNWMVCHILRDAALPVTWLLLHTQISANQVTLISLGVAALSLFCYSLNGFVFFLVSSLLLQFWYLLDHVDGQIARYRKTASLSGRFYDFIMHHAVHGSIFFTMSFYSFNQTQNAFFLVWGFLISLCIILFNLIHDAKYKTFFEKLKTRKTISLSQAEISNTGGSKPEAGLKSVFSILHKLCEIHVVMNIITIASLLQFFVPADLRFLLFLVYGIVVPFVSITKLSYIILRKKIDEEFAREFILQD